MFDRSADLYDALYVQPMDYPKQARKLATLIRNRVPKASTVLDVACGTGEHIRHLSDLGFRVDGVDIDRAMVRLASAKNPQSSIQVMDMIGLSLPRQYHVVMCLFSSIGYAKTESNLRKAMSGFAEHVVVGGLVIVEPWLTPESVNDGQVGFSTGSDGDRTLCRMTRTTVSGDMSVLEFEYLVGSSDGIERRSERHELGLFSAETMTGSMAAQGLAVEHDPEGLIGRGLYIGTKAPAQVRSP